MDALFTMSASPVLTGHQSCEIVLTGSSGRESRANQSSSTNCPSLGSPTFTTVNCSAEPGAKDFLRADSALVEATIRGGSDGSGRREEDVIVAESRIGNSGYESAVKAVAVKSERHIYQNCNQQKPAHVVKIKINSKSDNNSSRVVSAVTLNLDDISSTNGLKINGRGSDNYTGNAHYTNANKVDTNEYNNNDRSAAIVSNNGANSFGNSESLAKINTRNAADLGSSERASQELQGHISISTDNGRNGETLHQTDVAEPLSGSRTCYFYNSSLNATIISSGQSSPSETLDSGTCSDLDGTPPPLPRKNSSSIVTVVKPASVKLASQAYEDSYQRNDMTGSFTSSGAEVDSDDNESSISCDSLNSAERASLNVNGNFCGSGDSEGRRAKQHRPNEESPTKSKCVPVGSAKSIEALVDSDTIEGRKERLDHSQPSGVVAVASETIAPTIKNSKPLPTKPSTAPNWIVNECTYEQRQRKLENNNHLAVLAAQEAHSDNRPGNNYAYEEDRYYKFHIHEHDEALNEEDGRSEKKIVENVDECFAGYKIHEREAIRSAKGTVRGVKNRVRAGIATFLQKPSTKNYKTKDAGKVVVYTTTMGIVRETYYRCVLVKQILRTHMIKYEERDMYMSTELQTELRDRIGYTAIQVPQLFIDGQYIGDADTVERLNESGELRLILKPYKSLNACNTCQVCGGYCLLPCPVCNGSKKSMHRNDFTAEFIALKCMNCDEVGLVRCQHC